MIGLLKNNFYGSLGGAVILLVFFSIAGVSLLISGSPLLLTILVLVSATAFAFNAISSFRKEASTRWNKYELTTPVRRKDIIKSRYISYFTWVLIGIILSTIFVKLTILIHGNRYFYHELRDPISLFCASIGISLFMGTIFYPMIYFLGSDKNEIVMIISLLGAVGLTLGTLRLINWAHGFKTLSDPEFYLSISIFMAIAIIFFLLSYFLCIFVYKKKEY